MTATPKRIRVRQCHVCNHPERARLEMLRVGGASLDSLSERFNISRDSIHRHFKNHVSLQRRAELTAGPARVEELANAAAEESKSLLDHLGIVRSVLFNQFLAAAEAGDRPGVANVAGRLLESLRELGRLTGELREVSGITVNNNTLNLIASPKFLQLQEGLLQIARSHPGAKADIVALLRSLDEEHQAPRKINGHRLAPLIEGEAAHVE
jgi:hypothetical protein